jgi:hypothetical protein
VPDVPTAWKPLAAAALVAAGAAALIDRAPVAAHPRISTSLTWHRDIQPILAKRCLGCHVAGGQGPMALDDYATTRPWAQAIREEVMQRRMPPTGVRLGGNRFVNVPTIPLAEMEMLTAWIDGGAPKGNPDDQPPAPAPPPVPEWTAKATPKPATGPVVLDAPTSLLGLKLVLDSPEAFADVIAVHPGGRRDFLLRMGPPGSPDRTTYWLRRPLSLPKGTRVEVKAGSPFAMELMVGNVPAAPKTP